MEPFWQGVFATLVRHYVHLAYSGGRPGGLGSTRKTTTMAMDLRGPNRCFHLGTSTWSDALELALVAGWESAGTELPANPNWSGVYNSNDHQEVTADDASALADALDRAAPDIPRHDAVEHKLVDIGLGLQGLPDGEVVNPIEAFSGPAGRRMLLEFIAFCREGAFAIE